MPSKGFKGVTIRENLYKLAEKFIIDYNYRKGMKSIRSMSHLVELAIKEYIDNELERE